MSNTATTIRDIHIKHLTGDATIPADLVILLMQPLENFLSLQEQVVVEAERIADRMFRLATKVKENNAHVNSLGELQGSAAQFDILCARMEDARKAVETSVRLARRVANDEFANDLEAVIA
jgi:hypothetical protein